MSGLLNARKFIKKRKKFRLYSLAYRNQLYKRKEKSNPLGGKSKQAAGIVLKKMEFGAKQPNSGRRKCVVIQSTRSKRKIIAYMPGNLATSYIDEHDQVMIEGIGGSKGGAYGDIPKVRYKVIKVNNIALKQLVKRKVEKRKK